MTRDRILSFDKMSARRFDAQGFLHVETSNISKATVNPYFGSEIPNWRSHGLDPTKVYNVLRPAAELQKAAPTFNNLPLLDGHKEVAADELDDPELKRYVVGSTGTDATFDGVFLKNSLVVWTAGAIDGVSTGEQHELSCAYRYDFVHKPGTFNGMSYDGYMTNIIGNHVALVAEGRAGKDVVVADAAMDEGMEDVDSAEKALGIITALIDKEANAEKHKETPEQITALRAALAAIKRFITSEVEEVKPTGDSAHDKKEGSMGKPKPRTVTPYGHVIRGAILAYLKPRLAVDAAIVPGEISNIVKNVAPGRYSHQVPGLTGAVMDAFKGRITEDATCDELNALLMSLEPELAADASLCKDCGKPMGADKLCKDCSGKMAQDEDDESSEEPETVTDCASFAKKYNLSQDAADELQGIITAHKGKLAGDAMPEETKTEQVVKPEEQKVEAVVGITQDALDAAIVAAQEATRKDIGARFQAAKDVAHIVGDVDALAADSAAAIYKLALDSKKINTEGVDPSAFKALLAAIPAAPETTVTTVAADAKSVEDFTARYPHATRVQKG